jgi:hypothetical protein
MYGRLLLRLRHRVAGDWDWEEIRTVCYQCHATRPAPPRWPLLARICYFLSARFWVAHAKRAGWILAFYARLNT